MYITCRDALIIPFNTDGNSEQAYAQTPATYKTILCTFSIVLVASFYQLNCLHTCIYIVSQKSIPPTIILTIQYTADFYWI